MSDLTAFFIVCGVIVTVTPVLLWQIHQAWKAEQAKNTDPYEADAAEPIGADDPRLPAGINRLLDDYAALDPDLRHVFGPTAPHHTTEGEL